ncbi:uncharacterized protein KD926_008972 [Aspergillus affinis]|uniref:uncharacterized protein n=1 Tax=Aspergillus affinis TaxID=1070780 RepID=UPI0022FE6945|nr:uncharacterized protein KD926_008972 [Aspergillus affinis]KAI9039871.1 hypothetical protein KD926_008972 [Aspergillus affinis]
MASPVPRDVLNPIVIEDDSDTQQQEAVPRPFHAPAYTQDDDGLSAGDTIPNTPCDSSQRICQSPGSACKYVDDGSSCAVRHAIGSPEIPETASMDGAQSDRDPSGLGSMFLVPLGAEILADPVVQCVAHKQLPDGDMVFLCVKLQWYSQSEWEQ